MPKRVLSVGNCSFDESSLRRGVRNHFDAEVDAATGAVDALRKLSQSRYDLVLINRMLHGDGRGGVELIRQIKSDPRLAATPVMLVSNYPDAQQAAVEQGGEPGFGKSELDAPSTVEKLRKFLE